MTNTTPPSWDDMRIVLEVVRHGSFKAASSALALHPANVARRITALEKRMNRTLFDRAVPGTKPTPDGKYLATIAELMERQVRRTDRFFEEGVPLEGIARIAMPSALAHSEIRKHLMAFQKEHPGVQLFMSNHREILRPDESSFDLAVVYGLVEKPDLIRLEFGVADYACYRATGSDTDPRVGPWVHSREVLGTNNIVWQWVEANVSADLIVVRTDDFCHYVSTILDGVVVGVLPRFVGASIPLLEQIGNPIDGLKVKVSLVTHHAALLAPQIAALWHYLIDRSAPDRLLGPALILIPGMTNA
ncbi:MAG: LysR family transcriptional regulator [Alphaproteobacteria bacterium GM202ARS2]|nr:LysR family transcriptional regulator [Alphaproteobacteria bacterium GM202ARS2]